MIVCKCVCGGWLHAQRDTLAAKAAAVVRHNDTLRHKAWRWDHVARVMGVIGSVLAIALAGRS